MPKDDAHSWNIHHLRRGPDGEGDAQLVTEGAHEKKKYSPGLTWR